MSERDTPATLYAGACRDGMRVEVIEGDLTCQPVEVIVNAANEHLQHGGGLAAAISRAGGRSIQAESDAWVRSHGPLPTGQAALTGAGALPYRGVIHAVGPVWRGGGYGEAGLLASAVRSALRLAAAQGWSSIAIPPISSGIFGYPVSACAGVIVDAVVDYADTRRDQTVALVRLVSLGRDRPLALAQAARRRCGPPLSGETN